MEDRDFSEVELRDMLQRASRLSEDVVDGRYVCASRLRKRDWEVIVEPDRQDELIYVITAYPVGSNP